MDEKKNNLIKSDEKRGGLKKIDKRDDVIEIPIGNYGEKVRKNPWILATIVLAIVLIGVIFSGGARSGDIGAEKAGENVIKFVNAQGQGTASLISATKEDNLYKITLDFEGQEVPVYATLDGKFLISNIIPLDDSLIGNPNGNVNTDSGTGGQSNVDDDAFLGEENAPVTIVEFSDYQCPFCKKFWSETLPLLKTQYIDTGKVKLVYRDYPLDTSCTSFIEHQLHTTACKSAQAAECVRKKSNDAVYFKYHDKLFENQAELSEANLKKWAKELGSDIGNCWDNDETLSEVLNDISDGGGNLGTPAFFINGVKVVGAQPFANFKQVIDAQLV